MHSLSTLFRDACRFVLVALAVAWARPALAAKIACVGDSITYGYGLTNPAQQSYPAVLQTLVGSKHTVQNFGSSGCTLLKKGDKPYWNDANFAASDAFKPDVVVVMLGTNDAKPQNWSHKADFAGDYKSMIDHYRALGALVYIAVPPPVYPPGAYDINPDVLSGEVVPLVRQVAADASAPLVDVFQALSGKAGDFPDTVHPNADGSQLIAQTVAAALQAGGYGGAAGSTGTGGSSTGGGGITGSGGAPRGTGGSSTNSGGTFGSGGVPGTGGASPGSGGIVGTGGASSASGGIPGSGGISGTGGTSKGPGGFFGSGGTSGSGWASTETGGASGAGAALGTGGQIDSSGMGGGTAGASGTTVERAAKAGGCGCHLFGEGPAHGREYLVVLLLLTMLMRGPRDDSPEKRV